MQVGWDDVGCESEVELLQALLLLLHRQTQLSNLGVSCKFGAQESISALLFLKQFLGGG